MNVASILQVVAGFSWLIFIGVLFVSGVSASRGKPLKNAAIIIIGIAILSILFTTVSAGLVFVRPDERAVVISALAPKGYRDLALTPGLHWVIPYFENTVFYSISRQTYTMSKVATEGQVIGDDSVSARTSDGQEVLIDASVIFSIDPNQVPKLHIEWQTRYANDLVRPLARGIIRDSISQFKVDQVYSSKRAEVVAQMNEMMKTKLQENGIMLHDFVIRDLTFSAEYGASVEQKQISEQKAQQAKFVVEQRRQEAEQARQVSAGKADAAVIEAEGSGKSRLIQAKAEADALKMIGDALKGQGDLLTYQYITNLAPGIQVMLVPNDNPYLLPLPAFPTPAAKVELNKQAEIIPIPLPTLVPSPSPTPVE